MAGEPLSARLRADTTDRAVEHAREHLERLGYRLLEQHLDRRTGARLLVASSRARSELVFCELRVERLRDQARSADGPPRKRLRRAALAWLTGHPRVDGHTVRFDRLSVFVGDDGIPVGLEREPQAF
jgi:Holliday junction resolvase-like predicted endonuclease